MLDHPEKFLNGKALVDEELKRRRREEEYCQRLTTCTVKATHSIEYGALFTGCLEGEELDYYNAVER